MRLGPLQLSRVRAASAPTNELGTAGTSIGRGSSVAGFGAGVLLEQDYNPDLQGTRLYDEYDKMRIGDSVITGALKAIKLPLLSADWDFEPGDDSPEQAAIAEWLSMQLGKMNWS